MLSVISHPSVIQGPVPKTQLEEMFEFARFDIVDPRIPEAFQFPEGFIYGIEYRTFRAKPLYMMGWENFEPATLLDALDYAGKSREKPDIDDPIVVLGSKVMIEDQNLTIVISRQSQKRHLSLVEVETARDFRALGVKRLSQATTAWNSLR